MEYEILNNDDELTHWGIKGMKWGVRRYQNKDGSLTPAGEKRRAKLERELEKVGGKKSGSDGNKSDSSPSKKSVSEMSNEELRKHTERMNAEKNYYEAQRNLANALPPKQVSKGKQLAEKFFKDTVLPEVGKATKPVIESYLKKVLGLETKDELAEVKRAFEILDYRTKIDKINNPDKYLSYEDRKKKRDYDDETARREKAAKDREAEMDKYNEYNKNLDGSESYIDPRSSGEPYSKNSGEKTYTGFGGIGPSASGYSNNSSNESSTRTVTGTVEGVGNNSSKKNADSARPKKDPVIIDMEVDDLPAVVSDRGRTYVTAYLEEPKGLTRR